MWVVSRVMSFFVASSVLPAPSTEFLYNYVLLPQYVYTQYLLCRIRSVLDILWESTVWLKYIFDTRRGPHNSSSFMILSKCRTATGNKFNNIVWNDSISLPWQILSNHYWSRFYFLCFSSETGNDFLLKILPIFLIQNRIDLGKCYWSQSVNK